jgi:hypothetical protein
VLVYLGTQGEQMAERNAAAARATKAQFNDYVQDASGAGCPAAEIAMAKDWSTPARSPAGPRRNTLMGLTGRLFSIRNSTRFCPAMEVMGDQVQPRRVPDADA